MTKNTKVVYLKPCELAVVTSVGPYQISEKNAWCELFEWLDIGQHHEPNGLGFGLNSVVPGRTQNSIGSYTAGVRVPRSWTEADWESIQQRTFSGGAYMLRENIATYDEVAEFLFKTTEQAMPRVGLYFDSARPVLSLHRHDPRVVASGQPTVDMCIPVSSERRSSVRGN